MRPPQIFRAALSLLAISLLAILVVARADPRPTTTDPGATFALPTAPPATDPPEPPPATIPAGFVFPVPSPMNAGNAWIYAQRVLFERTGSLCFTSMEAEDAGDRHFESMAAGLDGSAGLLADGRSYVGPLEGALAALDLEPTGIGTGTVAYGIGLVTAERAMPQLPEGTVWAPRLTRFQLNDGRIGWTLSASWTAVVDRACGVMPTTPG